MRKNALLIMLILGIGLTLLVPSVLAAPKADDKSVEKQATLFDPFAMQAVTLTSSNTDAYSQTDLRLTRRNIRVPFRPALRSAFRPVW